MSEKELSFTEKARLYWKMKNPFRTSITDLAKAIPDKKNYGPYSMIGDGRPGFYLQKFLMVAGYILLVVMYFTNEAIVAERIILSERWLFVINALGLGGGGLGSIALIQFLYDSHRGTWDFFEDIWEPWRVLDLDGKVRFDVNRILESRVIWNPADAKRDDDDALREVVPP